VVHAALLGGQVAAVERLRLDDAGQAVGDGDA